MVKYNYVRRREEWELVLILGDVTIIYISNKKNYNYKVWYNNLNKFECLEKNKTETKRQFFLCRKSSQLWAKDKNRIKYNVKKNKERKNKLLLVLSVRPMEGLNSAGTYIILFI